MSTKFYNDIKGNDLSEFLAASEVYQNLTGGFDKTASNEENMNSFLLEVSRERNRSPHSALNNVDVATLQKIAQEVGVTAPKASNTADFIDKVEFAADCGRNMAHDYVKQANFGSSVAKFVAKNPRTAVGAAGAAVGAAGGYVAGDGEGAVLGGLAGGAAGALGGKRLIQMASGKKAVLGKGVQNSLNNAQREMTVAKRTAKRLPTAPAANLQQPALPGMEAAVGSPHPLGVSPGAANQTAPAHILENNAARQASLGGATRGDVARQTSLGVADPHAAAAAQVAPTQMAPNPAQGELFGSAAGVNPYAPTARPVAPQQPAQRGLFGRMADRAGGWLEQRMS